MSRMAQVSYFFRLDSLKTNSKTRGNFFHSTISNLKSKIIRHRIGFAILCYVIGPENLAPFSQPISCQTKNQSQPGDSCFPALYTVCSFLLFVLIGSLGYFPLLWLAVVIALVLRHSIEERSNSHFGIYVLGDTENLQIHIFLEVLSHENKFINNVNFLV